MDSDNTVAQIQDVNVPEIQNGTTALSKNIYRGAWSIQNLSTEKLYIRLGANCTDELFHFVIPGGSEEDDGNGGTVSQAEGIVWAGEISVFGTDKRYVAMEL